MAQTNEPDAVEEDPQKPSRPAGPVPGAPLTVVTHELSRTYRVRQTKRRRSRGKRKSRTSRRTVEVAALRGISLTVQSGEFVGVIGRNGSGKSTLLRMLAGVEAPSSGTVLTSARPSLLGVSAALIPDLTGAENIRLGALAMGMTPEEAEGIFGGVVELAGLGDSVFLPMRTYSSGMGSRLKFAISMAAQPEILMIDEALATGDASFAERAQRAANALLERSGTVFMVNHAAQTIEQMCTRAVWLEDGRVVLDGDAVEVARKYRWFAHNLAQGDEAKAEGLLRDAIAQGEAERREVVPVQPAPTVSAEGSGLALEGQRLRLPPPPNRPYETST